MNENPEGTPNPLNPNPAPAPEPVTQPTPAPEPVTQPAAPAPAAPAAKPANPGPSQGHVMDFKPQANATPATQPATATPASVASTPAPTPAPTQPAPPATAQTTAATAAQPVATPAQPAPAKPTTSAMPVMGQPAAKPVAAKPAASKPAMATTAEQIAAQPADIPAEILNSTAPTPVQPVDTPAAPEKKKIKPGILASIILAAVAAVCGIAAIIVAIVINTSTNPVNAAVDKLLDGGTPTNTSLGGTLMITNSDETATLSALTVDFTRVGDARSHSNATSATVEAKLGNGQKLNFDFSSVELNGEDVYIRVSGITDALEKIQTNLLEAPALTAPAEGLGEALGEAPAEALGEAPADALAEGLTETPALVENLTECPEGETCEPELIAPVDTSGLTSMLGIFEMIDGEWIHLVSVTEETEIEFETSVGLENNLRPCLVNAAKKMNTASISNLYSQNPFITYTTDNLKIVQKNNPLYKLNLDTTKLSAFNNALNTSAGISEFLTCMGGEIAEIDPAAVTSLFSGNPTLYVEIDDNHNFTRVYLDATTADELTQVKADISVSYPATITISEPAEYIEARDLILQILMQVITENIPEGEVVTEVEVVE